LPTSAATLPAQLVKAFREGRAAVFVGAGASIAAGLPSWQELVAKLASELPFEPDLPGGVFSPHALLNIPQYYEYEFGRRELHKRLEELLSEREPSRIHNLLAQLPNRLYYTTNFDGLLEDALRDSDRTQIALIADDDEVRYRTDHRGIQVRKLHGTIERHRTIVLTRGDYASLRTHNPLMFETLRSHLSEYAFLFVGYSLNDPDFTAIFDDVLLTMGDMRQMHYMCIPSVHELERQDLRHRGIEAIDLGTWGTPGAPTEGLTAFLTELAAETSDITHVKRFFDGVRRGDEVPIIVSSRTHEHEQFVYIAECDLHVATQVEEALGRLGCTTRRVADRRALHDVEMLAQHDLVLVCSPFGNDVTARAFELISGGPGGIGLAFEDDEGIRSVHQLVDARRFHADNPVDADGSARSREHAVIARYRNPWNPERRLFVFAGLYALGTHAVGTFLKDLRNYERIPDGGAHLEAVLTMSYHDHDPYDYRYEIDDIVAVSR
jgi:hypothetical protein